MDPNAIATHNENKAKRAISGLLTMHSPSIRKQKVKKKHACISPGTSMVATIFIGVYKTIDLLPRIFFPQLL
jgi:hypothetical protein